MASQSSQSLDTRSTNRNSLLYLPNELLLMILEKCPDFTTLWALINTSVRLAGLFDSYALNVTKSVLHSTVPKQTRFVMGAVFRIMAGTFECRTFTLGTVRQFPLDEQLLEDLDNLYKSRSESIISEDTICTLKQVKRDFELAFREPFGPVTSPSLLRTFISTAHRLHALAHTPLELYLDHQTATYFRECLSENYPAPLLDCNWEMESDACRLEQEAWIVEQRSILNLWLLYFSTTIKWAGIKGSLIWPTKDIKQLQRIDPASLTYYHRKLRASEYLALAEETNKYFEELKAKHKGVELSYRMKAPEKNISLWTDSTFRVPGRLPRPPVEYGWTSRTPCSRVSNGKLLEKDVYDKESKKSFTYEWKVIITHLPAENIEWKLTLDSKIKHDCAAGG